MKKEILTPAQSITKAASKQTFYTIRFLADRARNADAYRAYAYFRWVDDILDAPLGSGTLSGEAEALERRAFLERQKSLLDQCYHGKILPDASIQEQMLVELVRNDPEKDSGLQAYLHSMMQVMDFDTRRRGRLISQVELSEYTRWLAVAVTEGLLFFIGHGEYAPRDDRRYLAVSAAHITHMLRDTFDDIQAGYYNIPREVLEANHISPQDIQSPAYRVWVKSRIELARQYFQAGRDYFSQVSNARCRLACFAYIARFDWLLDTIEKEGYCLRQQYEERKHLKKRLRMGWLALSCALNFRPTASLYQPIASNRMGKP